MGWNNVQYYQKIMNGYKDGNGKIKKSNPTVNFLFGGIHFGMDNFDSWEKNKDQINKLISKYFIPN